MPQVRGVLPMDLNHLHTLATGGRRGGGHYHHYGSSTGGGGGGDLPWAWIIIGIVVVVALCVWAHHHQRANS